MLFELIGRWFAGEPFRERQVVVISEQMGWVAVDFIEGVGAKLKMPSIHHDIGSTSDLMSIRIVAYLGHVFENNRSHPESSAHPPSG